jgi:hypothetical protein
MQAKQFWRGAAFLAAAFVGGMVGSWALHPDLPEASEIHSGKGRVAGTFGVGGVLTTDGKLWQDRPDKTRWVTLDESFALEEQGTSAYPLPVPMESIRFMETFGFLVTQEDECWLYDVDQQRWKSVGTPPR